MGNGTRRAFGHRPDGRGRRADPALNRDNDATLPHQPNDAELLSYFEVRDRFLSATPESLRDGVVIEAAALSDALKDQLEYFCAIGTFVFQRWTAEELHRPDKSQPVDETATEHIWSTCTERAFRGLRAEARASVESFIHEAPARALLTLWWKRLEPVSDAIVFVRWSIVEGYKGFVTAAFVVVVSLVFARLLPDTVIAIRKMFNDTLAETRSPPAATQAHPSST